MTLHWLADWLRGADPRARVDALRVLAMVEETRALDAVTWIATHDPEPGVRSVAEWAAAILRDAQVRGHSTAKALEALYHPKPAPDREAHFLLGLEAVPGRSRAQQIAIEHIYERHLEEALSTRQADAAPAQPVPTSTPHALPRVESLDDFAALLEAGLVHLRVEQSDD